MDKYLHRFNMINFNRLMSCVSTYHVITALEKAIKRDFDFTKDSGAEAQKKFIKFEKRVKHMT